PVLTQESRAAPAALCCGCARRGNSFPLSRKRRSIRRAACRRCFQPVHRSRPEGLERTPVIGPCLGKNLLSVLQRAPDIHRITVLVFQLEHHAPTVVELIPVHLAEADSRVLAATRDRLRRVSLSQWLEPRPGKINREFPYFRVARINPNS